MLSALARAIEAFFGPALQPASSLLRIGATVALIALLIAAAWVAVRALTAWRFGWTTVPAVVCPRCGRLVVDRTVASCPDGHPIRFPSSTRPEESARRRRALGAAYPVLLAATIGAVSVLAYRATALERLTRPLSTIAAAMCYLFVAASIAAAAFAIVPGRRGTASRIVHLALAAACFFPAVTLLLFARALEPRPEREIGALWTTPASLYVARAGQRAVNCGPAVERAEARLLEARLPVFGVVWQGLSGFSAAGRDIPWNGSGGFASRLLERVAKPADPNGVVTSSRALLTIEPNRRLTIWSNGERIRFAADE